MTGDLTVHTSRVSEFEVVGDAIVSEQCPEEIKGQPISHDGKQRKLNTVYVYTLDSPYFEEILVLHVTFYFSKTDVKKSDM